MAQGSTSASVSVSGRFGATAGGGQLGVCAGGEVEFILAVVPGILGDPHSSTAATTTTVIPGSHTAVRHLNASIVDSAGARQARAPARSAGSGMAAKRVVFPLVVKAVLAAFAAEGLAEAAFVVAGLGAEAAFTAAEAAAVARFRGGLPANHFA